MTISLFGMCLCLCYTGPEKAPLGPIVFVYNNNYDNYNNNNNINS